MSADKSSGGQRVYHGGESHQPQCRHSYQLALQLRAILDKAWGGVEDVGYLLEDGTAVLPAVGSVLRPRDKVYALESSPEAE